VLINCYFWESACLLQWGDISGWVQGIGSLLALIIAVRIALQQRKDMIQMEVDKTAYTEKLKVEAILALFVQVECFIILAERDKNSYG